MKPIFLVSFLLCVSFLCSMCGADTTVQSDFESFVTDVEVKEYQTRFLQPLTSFPANRELYKSALAQTGLESTATMCELAETGKTRKVDAIVLQYWSDICDMTNLRNSIMNRFSLDGEEFVHRIVNWRGVER